MSKPHDISQEAWDIYQNVMSANGGPAYIARAIMAATLAEREACAQVAAGVADQMGKPAHKLAPTHVNIRKAVAFEIANSIAAAIRKRGEA